SVGTKPPETERARHRVTRGADAGDGGAPRRCERDGETGVATLADVDATGADDRKLVAAVASPRRSGETREARDERHAGRGASVPRAGCPRAERFRARDCRAESHRRTEKRSSLRDQLP